MISQIWITLSNDCGRVAGNERFWSQSFDAFEDAGAIADVEFVVSKVVEGSLKALLVPAGVALRAKEDRSLVVINRLNRYPVVENPSAGV